jgi:hypothetical protein
MVLVNKWGQMQTLRLAMGTFRDTSQIFNPIPANLGAVNQMPTTLAILPTNLLIVDQVLVNLTFLVSQISS